MEIKSGMVFRDPKGDKFIVVNTFIEKGKKVITYKYWLKHKRRWIFKTDFEYLFIISFDYGWKWDK